MTTMCSKGRQVPLLHIVLKLTCCFQPPYEVDMAAGATEDREQRHTADNEHIFKREGIANHKQLLSI